MSGGSAHGLTFPLLTTASGVKIGKTEGAQGGEMVWLDPQLTSPYRMYQYWINTDDRDVVKFLKLFTFLGLETIGELEEILRQNPGKREPHRVLALEFTKMVHGEEAAKSVREVSEILFGREVHEISPVALDAMAVEVPVTRISIDRLQSGCRWSCLAEQAGQSRATAIWSARAYVNSEPEGHRGWDRFEPGAFGRAVLLRRKKTYHLFMVCKVHRFSPGGRVG
jgi:tyrosyl-tRNA synthetase